MQFEPISHKWAFRSHKQKNFIELNCWMEWKGGDWKRAKREKPLIRRTKE